MEENNQSVLNYDNDLVSSRTLKKEEKEKLEKQLEYLKGEIERLGSEISKLVDCKYSYRMEYVSRSFNILKDKFKLRREGKYACKMAKFNMQADVLFLTKKGESINANKLMPKSKRTKDYEGAVLDENLYGVIRKATVEEADSTVEGMKTLSSEINEKTSDNSLLKTKMNANKANLSAKRKQRREKRNQLLEILKQYSLLCAEYKKIDKKLKSTIKVELDQKTNKTR